MQLETANQTWVDEAVTEATWFWWPRWQLAGGRLPRPAADLLNQDMDHQPVHLPRWNPVRHDDVKTVRVSGHTDSSNVVRLSTQQTPQVGFSEQSKSRISKSHAAIWSHWPVLLLSPSVVCNWSHHCIMGDLIGPRWGDLDPTRSLTPPFSACQFSKPSLVYPFQHLLQSPLPPFSSLTPSAPLRFGSRVELRAVAVQRATNDTVYPDQEAGIIFWFFFFSGRATPGSILAKWPGCGVKPVHQKQHGRDNCRISQWNSSHC